MITILAFIAAILIGVSLGLIGSGGSILTVPVLVYILGIDAVSATGYSLFIVGVSALLGAYRYFRRQELDLKFVFLFGIPSIIAVYFTRAWLVPVLPDELFEIGAKVITKSTFLLLLFAVLMLVAAYSMIRKSSGKTQDKMEKVSKPWSWIIVLLEGLFVGVLTGMVGAGGGFLIIPVLVLVTGLPMKKAIGTSLAIVALKSLIGFSGDMVNLEIDWPMLMSFTGFSVLGIFVGGHFSKRVSGEKLKPAFGIFILVMGLFILTRELFL
mgnify:CR=1 FL=1